MRRNNKKFKKKEQIKKNNKEQKLYKNTDISTETLGWDFQEIN